VVDEPGVRPVVPRVAPAVGFLKVAQVKGLVEPVAMNVRVVEAKRPPATALDRVGHCAEGTGRVRDTHVRWSTENDQSASSSSASWLSIFHGHQPVPLSELFDLVHAVAEEPNRVGALENQLGACVGHHELPALGGLGAGKGHDQRGKHARALLRVLVGEEERTRGVEQDEVELDSNKMAQRLKRCN
jgi:hypothetical protein